MMHGPGQSRNRRLIGRTGRSAPSIAPRRRCEGKRQNSRIEEPPSSCRFGKAHISSSGPWCWGRRTLVQRRCRGDRPGGHGQRGRREPVTEACGRKPGRTRIYPSSLHVYCALRERADTREFCRSDQAWRACKRGVERRLTFRGSVRDRTGGRYHAGRHAEGVGARVDEAETGPVVSD